MNKGAGNTLLSDHRWPRDPIGYSVRPPLAVDPRRGVGYSPGMRGEHEQYRIRSTRGYRRMADQALRMAMTGKMDPKDAAAIVAACKAGTEMFMAEKVLERAGQDQDSGEKHQLGQDGSFEPTGTKAYRHKKVVVKTGIGKMGDRIDEKSVTIGTSAEDDASEAAAEAETLS